MCPYCGSNSWRNSWGAGNSQCNKCAKEFNVIFEKGRPKGIKPEETKVNTFWSDEIERCRVIRAENPE